MGTVVEVPEPASDWEVPPRLTLVSRLDARLFVFVDAVSGLLAGLSTFEETTATSEEGLSAVEEVSSELKECWSAFEDELVGLEALSFSFEGLPSDFAEGWPALEEEESPFERGASELARVASASVSNPSLREVVSSLAGGSTCCLSLRLLVDLLRYSWSAQCIREFKQTSPLGGLLIIPSINLSTS